MDDNGIIGLLQDMVRAPSHKGVPRQEEGTARALEAYLRRHGIAAELVEVREGRPNVVASIEGRKPGRHLLLCGHMDTVPPNEGAAADFFSARTEGGRMFGRGTVDMKGALAAMAGALADLRASGGPEAGRVTLAAVIDEELESLGAEALIRSGLRADGAIIGEPSGNRVAIGHKGLEWLEASFFGKAVHGSVREEGVDAIAAAAYFVSLVENELIPGFARHPDPAPRPVGHQHRHHPRRPAAEHGRRRVPGPGGPPLGTRRRRSSKCSTASRRSWPRSGPPGRA